MLEYKHYRLLAGLLIIVSYAQGADHLLTFFLKPSFIHKQTDTHPESIMVTYGGYLDTTDHNGQIVFPRMGPEASFVILITPLIRPVFMLGNTIHHWELVNNLAHQAFNVQRVSEQGSLYWVITQLDTLEDNIVPLNAIVILGNPEDFSVSVGKTPTHDKPQFIFPPILVHRYWSGYRDQSVLGVSTIKEFFGGLSPLSKEQKEGYLSSLQVPR